ncbi:MAG: hypothetical protein J6R77_05560, partial [Clostridia bacterium]|nr:hypothetical protein [Clostridia bacterium]
AVDKDPFWPFPPPLLYKKLSAPPEGEPVPFTVGETVDSRKSDHFYEAREKKTIHLIQSKAQWDYIRTRYGFTKTYDAAFFAEHSLVFMDVIINHYTSEFALEQIAQNGPALEIHYRIYSDKPYALPACYNATTVAEIPKAVADEITRLSVYVSN